MDLFVFSCALLYCGPLLAVLLYVCRARSSNEGSCPPADYAAAASGLLVTGTHALQDYPMEGAVEWPLLQLDGCFAAAMR